MSDGKYMKAGLVAGQIAIAAITLVSYDISRSINFPRYAVCAMVITSILLYFVTYFASPWTIIPLISCVALAGMAAIISGQLAGAEFYLFGLITAITSTLASAYFLPTYKYGPIHYNDFHGSAFQILAAITHFCVIAATMIFLKLS